MSGSFRTVNVDTSLGKEVMYEEEALQGKNSLTIQHGIISHHMQRRWRVTIRTADGREYSGQVDLEEARYRAEEIDMSALELIMRETQERMHQVFMKLVEEELSGDF